MLDTQKYEQKYENASPKALMNAQRRIQSKIYKLQDEVRELLDLSRFIDGKIAKNDESSDFIKLQEWDTYLQLKDTPEFKKAYKEFQNELALGKHNEI